MTFARGNSAALMMRRQTAFKTPEADGAGTYFKLPFYSYAVGRSEETEQDPALYGDDHPGEIVRGLQNLAGDLVVPLGLQSIGWHLSGLFGLPTTVGGAPDYVHTFAAGPAQTVLAHTAGISHAGIGQHFKQIGLAYAGMTLNAAKNGSRARATFQMIGHREDGAQAATVDATPTTFTNDRVPVGFECAVYQGGDLTADVVGLDLAISKGVAPDQEILNQSPFAEAALTGRWAATGTVRARFKDKGWYNRPAALTTLELRYPISAALSLSILLRNVQFAQRSIEIPSADILTSDFSFEVGRPPVGQDPIVVTLANQQPNYANL